MLLTLKVETNLESGKSAMTARAGKHTVILDEVASAGGTDQGPNPLQYLLSGLGGCFMAMGRVVAGEMGLNIEHIRCRLEGDVNPDGMFERDKSVRPGCQEIRMSVNVKTSEPAEKIATWLETVERRCAVRDCIANPTPIKVVLEK